MKLSLALAASIVLGIPSATLAVVQAQAPVRCSIDYAPDRACQMSDTVAGSGVHRMVFRQGNRTLVFVGRSNTGWWAGKLDGRPAMGYERNRGNVVFSTYDLRTTLSWWYPRQEHGSY